MVMMNWKKKTLTALLTLLLTMEVLLPTAALAAGEPTDTLPSPVIPPHTHEGGEANCTEQAICDICGEPYGELDPSNHEWGEWTDYERQGDQMLQRRVCELNEEHVEWQYVAAEPEPTAEPEPPLPVGTIIEHTNGRTYKVLHDGTLKLVSVSKADKKKTTIRVASYITVNGRRYTITQIGARAFAGCKKLRTLKIESSTIKSIHPNAFYRLTSAQKAKIQVRIKSTNPNFAKLKKNLVKARLKSNRIKKVKK